MNGRIPKIRPVVYRFFVKNDVDASYRLAIYAQIRELVAMYDGTFDCCDVYSDGVYAGDKIELAFKSNKNLFDIIICKDLLSWIQQISP